MGFGDIRNWSFKIFKRLTRQEQFGAIVILRNAIETQDQELKKYKEEIQALRDTVNRLKGEKGKPDIKPAVDSDKDSDDDKDDDDEGGPKNKNHKKRNKKDTIKVDREVKAEIDKSKLPPDAQYKGSREIIIQDIKIGTDNIKIIIPRFYSPLQNETFEGEIPQEYRGSEFGPGLWAFIKQMHTEGRITQNVLWKIVKGMGIDISEGQIANIIVGNKGIEFAQEMQDARVAGMKKENNVGIDDTGARIDGKNGATIVTGNEYFASYLTEQSKNRLSAIKALMGVEELQYCLNKDAIKYINEKISNKELVRRLRNMASKRLFSEIEFFQEIMELPWIKDKIDSWRKHIRDGCAIGTLRDKLRKFGTLALICDDAPQFKGILRKLGLCWVHEARHYKKLEPSHVDFRAEKEKFLEFFWEYYKKLKEYKLRPTARKKKKLSKEFDELFSGKSSYYAMNAIMKKTLAKKEELLLVLDLPEIPLHNNGRELSARESVKQRNIRNCFRSWIGARASDLSLSLMATCRKVKVSFGEFLKDRFYHRGQIPPLAQIIHAMP